MDVSEVHKTKGKICSYVLKCAAPAHSDKDAYYYVGMTEDLRDLNIDIIEPIGDRPYALVKTQISEEPMN